MNSCVNKGPVLRALPWWRAHPDDLQHVGGDGGVVDIGHHAHTVEPLGNQVEECVPRGVNDDVLHGSQPSRPSSVSGRTRHGVRQECARPGVGQAYRLQLGERLERQQDGPHRLTLQANDNARRQQSALPGPRQRAADDQPQRTSSVKRG
eukprot:scaffold7571_cov403-Prasinococcus_capsulatus_cf.AAC.2